jgi:deoxyribonuclease-4
MAILGAHISTAGGAAKAFGRGAEIGCHSMQIFVKSPNQWRAKALADADVESFRAAHVSAPQPIVAHAAYLINLASPKEEVLEKSKAALLDELQRCTALGVSGLVLHPGAHLGEGEDAGIDRIARSLDEVLAADGSLSTKVLLENTAGQGSTLGSKFGQLQRIIELVDNSDMVGACLDSCHAFSAGYDLRSGAAYRDTMDEFASTVGLARLAVLHLNDSKHPLGSRKDRHENVGAGQIGLEFFARIIHDAALSELPMILETPLGDDGLGHKNDLEILRNLEATA